MQSSLDDDAETQEPRKSSMQRSKVNTPRQSVELEVHGTAPFGLMNQGQERTYIDITAIPRLQSGNLFSVVQAYVSLVDCLRCELIVFLYIETNAKVTSNRLQYMCKYHQSLAVIQLLATAFRL